jgi:predicted O-methyltransferase YrrM
MAAFKNVVLTQQIYDYMRGCATPPTPVQAALIHSTENLGDVAEMQIPYEQGKLLTLFATLLDARLVLDVGTFTGYSALALAQGLPATGKVITLDRTDEWSALARKAWSDAGVADRIEFRPGLAMDALRALPRTETVDLAFIDADKVSYVDYWEELVPRVRAGGLLLADNVLYGGAAADENATGNAQAIRRFNQHVLADDRVESFLLPVADGLTVARKTRSTDPSGAW